MLVKQVKNGYVKVVLICNSFAMSEVKYFLHMLKAIFVPFCKLSVHVFSHCSMIFLPYSINLKKVLHILAILFLYLQYMLKIFSQFFSYHWTSFMLFCCIEVLILFISNFFNCIWILRPNLKFFVYTQVKEKLASFHFLHLDP